MPAADVCTIIAKNYLAQARVLGRSLARFCPDVRFRVLVIDDVRDHVVADDEPFELVDPAQIGIPRFQRMAGMYDVLELSTAVKPWLLQWLLRQPDSTGAVIYLDPDMRVYAPLDALVRAVHEHEVVLCPHNLDPMPRDGRRPNEQDILIAGAYNLGFVGLAAGARTDHLLSWWAERLEYDCVVDPERGFFVDQRWFDFVPAMVEDCHLWRDRGFNVAYWNLPDREISSDADGRWLAGGAPLTVFHFSGFDPAVPHRLSKHQDRIDLARHPHLARLCEEYAEELLACGAREVSQWPYGHARTASGVELNRTLRGLYRAAVIEEGFDGSLFTAEGERRFFDRLNAPAASGGAHGVTRYLEHLWTLRPDLQRAYPRLDEPQDAEGLIGWAHVFAIGEVPPPLRPPRRDAAPSPVPAPPQAALPSLSGVPLGVNVAGYLQAELGVGEVARQAVAALDGQGVPVLPVGVPAPLSRQHHPFAVVPPPERAFPVNLLCVNADVLSPLVDALGHAFFAGRYTIGWWWWEVDAFPDRWRGAFDLVDEVWTGSRFVQEALAAVASVPVVRVPVPVSVSSIARPDREGLGLPQGPLFLFIFDHHSVFERKNPLGVIEAFTQAFPEPGTASLVVKSINGSHHPEAEARLRRAAAPHPHVHLMEDYLSHDDRSRLLASCDAYVSLHRSEGFGMTMAEAMLMGKPVIATGHSGNLDFMTPDNALLVRHVLRPVGPGAEPYPAEARWAEPDLDHAAALMRRVVDEPQAMRELGSRAAADVQRTNGLAAAGAAMVERLRGIALRVPAPPHDHLWAARVHADEAAALAARGPQGADSRGALKRAARRAVLRAMRPATNHQVGIDRRLAIALGDLMTEVGALRAGGLRQVVTEAAQLRDLRRLEAAATARMDDLARQVDELRALLHRREPPVDAEAADRGEAPAVPWSHAYNAAHRAFVEAELDDVSLLGCFRAGEPLPDGFGVGFDERVVELPWVFAADLGGTALDAGSALNHRHVFERLRPRVDALHVLTLAPEERSFPELGVSYLYADLRELPIRDRVYDTVVCVSTLEHVGMDNTRFGAGHGDGARSSDPQAEAIKAVGELWRVLAPGGRLLVTVPVGAGERYRWVRSLGLEEVDALVAACPGATASEQLYRHAGGWRRATRDEVAGARYRDHTTSGPPADRIVAAEAVACLRLIKPGS